MVLVSCPHLYPRIILSLPVRKKVLQVRICTSRYSVSISLIYEITSREKSCTSIHEHVTLQGYISSVLCALEKVTKIVLVGAASFSSYWYSLSQSSRTHHPRSLRLQVFRAHQKLMHGCAAPRVWRRPPDVWSQGQRTPSARPAGRLQR